MSKVFIGNVSADAERLISKYLNKFMPDAVIEPLKAAGIKAKIKNHAKRPEVVLVIIDETFYNMCKGVADDVLSLPKVHKYVSDSGLQDFLVEKFGVLDDIPAVERVEKVEDKKVNEVTSDIIEDDFENESLTVSDNEDTSNNIDRDSIIRGLNDEIIIRDTMIRNLEAQIEEKSDSDSVSHFVERIKTLEKSLEESENKLSKIQTDSYADLGKITRAEQIISTVDTLKEELRIEKSKCNNLESNKSELEIRVQEQKQEIDKLRLSVVELGDKVKDLNELTNKFDKQSESLVSLQSDLDSRTSELTQIKERCTFLDAEVFDLNGKLSEIGVLNEKIELLESENKKLVDSNSDLASLKLELENLRVDYDKILSDKSELELKLTSTKSELDESLATNTTLVVDKDKLDRDIKTLQSDNVSISNQLTEITDKLKVKDDEIEILRTNLSDSSMQESKLEDATKEIEALNEEVSSLTMKLKLFEDTKSSLSDKVAEIDSLKEQLLEKSILEEELTSKTSELIALQQELSEKTAELDSLRNERNSQSSDIDDKNRELVSKQETITKLESSISSLTAEVDELTISNKKLGNEVDILRVKADESVTLKQSSSESEKELLDFKRKVARLQAENESLKDDLESSRGTTNKDVEISKLNSEISDYKEKLRLATDVEAEKSKSSEEEIQQLRERCANLEVSLIEKEDELKISSNNIFNRMSTIASPKTMFSLSLSVPKELPNMCVVASGSSESNLITYQTLRRFCSSTNKSVLIIDLVTDSYIDREFGVEKILSPIEFLQGSKSISEFITPTRIKNTRVSSTAFSYLNSLYLLNVDWQERLTELAGIADIVIINVGCLNEVVSKVLFNAFSEVMNSHILIKASPINLRTALLTLTGMSSAKKSKISCVGFENSSKAMYQRLAQKFDTQILKDSDVLKL